MMDSSRPVYLQGRGRGGQPVNKEAPSLNTSRRPDGCNRGSSKATPIRPSVSTGIGDGNRVASERPTASTRVDGARNDEASLRVGRMEKQKSLNYSSGLFYPLIIIIIITVIIIIF